MIRFRLILLLVLACGMVGACKDRDQTTTLPPHPATTPAATAALPEPLAEASLPDPRRVDPDVEIASPQVYTGPVPRMIIWPAVVDGSAGDSSGEIDYFMNLLRTGYGYAPHLVLDVYQEETWGRLLPSEESRRHRPLMVLADEELSFAARAYEAGTHLRSEFRKEAGGLEATFRLIDSATSTELLRIEARGGWDEINRALFAHSLEILSLAGVDVAERDAPTLSRSIFGGSMSHFERAARERSNPSRELRRASMEAWLEAEPGIPWLRTRILTDRLLDNKFDAKGAILRELDKPGPFNDCLALYFSRHLYRRGDKYTAMKVLDMTTQSNPGCVRHQLEAAWLAVELGETERALEYTRAAELASPDNWLVGLWYGRCYSQLSQKAYRGGTTPGRDANSRAYREKARSCLQAAALTNPNDAWVQYRLGSVGLESGLGEDFVRGHCEEALELDPSLQRAIVTMLRLYAPYYLDNAPRGWEILFKYKDYLTDPSVIMDASEPIFRLMIGRELGTEGAFVEYAKKHPREAVTGSQILVRGFSSSSDDRPLRIQVAWNALLMLESRQCTAPDLTALRENYLVIRSPQLNYQQWFDFSAGWVFEEAGDLKTARNLYDLAYRGPHAWKGSQAGVRLLVLDAKEGRVDKALEGLATHYGNIGDHDEFLMEILSQGNPEQRREAVRIGERVMSDSHHTINLYRRLAEAYFATGEPGKVRELIGANLSRGEPLEPSMAIRWKRACEQLGVSDQWPPTDLATPTPSPTGS